MTGRPARHLTGEEVAALKFAGRRQITRWANNPHLSPDQRARRNALKRAVHVLHDNAFSTGCELRAPEDEKQSDA